MYINEEQMLLLQEMRQRRIALTLPPHQGRELSFTARDGAELRPWLFYPQGETPRQALPLFFNIHGGGFVLGNAESIGWHCQRLADRLGIAVCSIEHRLAPEHPFPCDKLDAYDTVEFLASHADHFRLRADKMAIGGHSSGGNVAFGASMLAQRAGKYRFAALVLDYAPWDITRSESQKTGAAPQCLPGSEVEISALYNQCYRREEEARLPLCSPIFASDEELRQTPPSLLLVGSLDGLAAENGEMAARLQECGAEAEFHLFEGAPHGFTMRPGEAGEQARQLIEEFLRRYLCD